MNDAMRFALQAVDAFIDAAERGELSLEDTVKAWAYTQALKDLNDDIAT